MEREQKRRVAFWISFVLAILTGGFAVMVSILAILVEEAGLSTAAWFSLIIGWIVFLATVVVHVITTGRRDENGKVHLYWFDKIFFGVKLGLAMMVCTLFIPVTYLLGSVADSSWILGELFGRNTLHQLITTERMSLQDVQQMLPFAVRVFFLAVLLVGIFAFCGAVLESTVRTLKAKEFWKHTFIGWLILLIWNGGRKANAMIDGSGAQIGPKVLLKAILLFLAPFVWFTLVGVVTGDLGVAILLGIVFVIVELVWLYRKSQELLHDFENIVTGIEEIDGGNLEYQLAIPENAELGRMAQAINRIGDAEKIAVQKELKNEKMKTALISNVSHDIRTPLTSMVTYVDLLKKEGLDSPNAPEYLEILDQKTQRLRHLTDDLFEAAKASSGDLPVHVSRIEMVSIVNQALGEMAERLESRHIRVVFRPDAEKHYVYADGQQLWRVMENLLSNISKYAMEGTRAYLDLEKGAEPGMIRLVVRNISREPLHISPDVLLLEN